MYGSRTAILAALGCQVAAVTGRPETDAYLRDPEASRIVLGQVQYSGSVSAVGLTGATSLKDQNGSIEFSLQRLKEQRFSQGDQAFKTIPVTGSEDPAAPNWFPMAHPLAGVDSFSRRPVHMLGAVGGAQPSRPSGRHLQGWSLSQRSC